MMRVSEFGHVLPSALKSWHLESGRQQMVLEPANPLACQPLSLPVSALRGGARRAELDVRFAIRVVDSRWIGCDNNLLALLLATHGQEDQVPAQSESHHRAIGV